MKQDVHAILAAKFEAKHIASALDHFSDATDRYIAEDWDGVALKVGKFVEAVTKALMMHCGRPLASNVRHFKAGNELRQIEQSSGFPEAVRIVIPKAAIFIFEIVNNRGGRHDAGEIDANCMDAKAVIPQMQWILAELVRFSSVGGDIDTAARLIDGLINRVHPIFEKIDDRTYVVAEEIGAPEVAILLAYERYPNRVRKRDLEAAIVRHGFTKSVANKAVNKNKLLFDDLNGDLKLRSVGREKAEDILKRYESFSAYRRAMAA